MVRTGLVLCLVFAWLPARAGDAPSPPWLRPPPPGLLAFALKGKFPDVDPDKQKYGASEDQRTLANRIASDETFVMKHPRGDHNIWAALLKLETGFPADEIPQFPSPVSMSMKQIAEKYGSPSSRGEFVHDDGNKILVRWYGPVCLLAATEDGPCGGIGGWPSQLLDRRAVPPPEFTCRPHWPERSATTEGEVELTVANPNPFFVRVAARTGTKGKDFLVEPAKSAFVRLAPGTYDLYFQHAVDPEALFKGDAVKLVGGVETRIDLASTEGGKYAVRKVR